MRLKKLILQGFKSFADRTEFVFDAPITGIVGPNGCGKSNVVDGFKWVLGEQSAKSLRGEAMMDVIFNGSSARKPAGLAEVVLVFDNPKREDETRHLNIDADEVSVGRRLFRDGTSEYHLNNQQSRLKDIRELFLDTGVGVDAYSVIEQGKVSAMLEANPDERRIIFEEAAGISKYKQKKKETQRKLEKVDQNLLRVTDIVEEVEKRLRSVKVQAGKARNYQEYVTKLNELRLSYSLQEYHTFHTQLQEQTRKQEDAQFRMDDASADLQKAQNEAAAQREELDRLTQKKQQVDYELVQSRAQAQSSRQRQQYAQQQIAQIAEQLESFDSDKASLQQKLDAVVNSLDAETENLRLQTEQLEQGRKHIDDRQEVFKNDQIELNSLNQKIEQDKSAVLDLMRKLAQTNSRLGAIEIERRNIATHQERIGGRRRQVVEELDKLQADRADRQQKLDGVLDNIKQQQAAFEAKRAEAASLGKHIAQLSENLSAAKEHRSGLLSRQRVLQDLEAKLEGVSAGVKSVLRQRQTNFRFVCGLVADVLRVDVEHAHVIEAALDGKDQWLVTDDSAAALAASEQLAVLEGRVNIVARGTGSDAATERSEVGASSRASIAVEQVHSSTTVDAYNWNQHPYGVRLAVDLVRFEAQDAEIAHRLLGRTMIINDLATASALQREGPNGWRYVTKLGEVLEADGTLRAGPLTASMGLLSRHAELEAIAQQVAEVDGRIGALLQQLTEGNTAAKELEEQQNALRNAVYAANTQKVELTSQIAQLNDKVNSLQREQPVLERELQNLLDQSGRLKTEESQLLERRTQLETEQSERQSRIGEMTARHQEIADELRHAGEELTRLRVELGQVQEKQLASRQQVQRQTLGKTELSQQIERVVRSAAAVAGRQGDAEAELQKAKREEAQFEQRSAELTEQSGELAKAVAQTQSNVNELTKAVSSLRETYADVEAELHQLQLSIGELRVRVETLVTRTRDELQLDLPEKYASFSAPLEDGTDGPGYQPADRDWDAVAQQIKELREKIQRLGNVNIDAIGEQEELEKREQFLATQLTDLRTSKQQLEHLIEEINQESSVRFEQTFNTVREHFQGMFRKLFGGGKADIYLETELENKKTAEPIVGPDGQLMMPEKKKIDILDAGIEIIARPPGKQPATISQLSGGEKTMTCIALLMSIFKSKPSPFCILDEVDAALDEANNQRFNLIVQEFLDRSQFIVITHSKRTMQIAEMLYGVTMQEQGVSKRVAVKFDQVDHQGRIDQTATAAA